jgi:arylsulfatase A
MRSLFRLFIFSLCLTSVRAAAPPANVVVIFCDDLGYADIGPFGAKAYRTPNLDRMAAEGRKFSRFYVSSAVCSASRAALLTGCLHGRVSIHGALMPPAKQGLHPQEMTIADLLRVRGYATGIFGKWHLGRPPELLPLRQGFDEFFGLPYSNDMRPQHPELSNFPPLPLLEGDQILRTLEDQSDLTKQITERAVKFIATHKARPFFLYVPHPQPHVPLYCSAEFRGKSGAGLYGDVITELDWSVGEILKALKDQGLDERTLVVFTSDNGPWLSYGEHAGSAGPLREGKGTSWEGGIRVPCLMRWPGTIPPGTECTEVAATIDLLPTIAAITGDQVPPSIPKIDGFNILPLLKGEPGARSPRLALPIYYSGELQALISGQWKLVLPHTYRTLGDQPKAKDGVPVKYRNAAVTQPELYDLAADPGESKDVSAAHPEVMTRLTAAAEKYRAELGDAALKRKGSEVRPPGKVE